MYLPIWNDWGHCQPHVEIKAYPVILRAVPRHLLTKIGEAAPSRLMRQEHLF